MQEVDESGHLLLILLTKLLNSLSLFIYLHTETVKEFLKRVQFIGFTYHHKIKKECLISIKS